MPPGRRANAGADTTFRLAISTPHRTASLPILRALTKLRPVAGTAKDGCFEPPKVDLSYNVQKAAFFIGDPASLAIKVGLGTVKDSAIAVTKTVSNGFANAAKLLKEALTKLLPPRGGPRGGPSGSQSAAAASAVTPPSASAVNNTNTPPTTKVAPPNPSSTPRHSYPSRKYKRRR